MKKLLFSPLLFLTIMAVAQTKVVIVPEPVSMEMHSGNFNFSASTSIIAAENASHEAKMLNVYLKKLYGFTIPVKTKMSKEEKESSIVFNLVKNDERKDA
ncbi:MAG: glycoside hydrolase family 20 zincin-like fold domain-containing protein, partial [Ginsengibacter sp.]